MLKFQAKVGKPRAVAFTSDNKYLIVAEGTKIKLYSATSETLVNEFRGKSKSLNLGHTKRIISVTTSPDNSLIASTGLDNSICLWAYPGGQLVGKLLGHQGPVISARFVGGHQFIASISEDQCLKFWDTKLMKEIYTKCDDVKPLRALSVIYNDKLLATAGGDCTIKIRNTFSGEIISEIKDHTNWVRSLSFSPDGKLLASAGDDGRINLIDLETNSVIQRFKLKGWIYDIEFSGDGRYLAVASEKHAIIIYEILTGLVVANFSKINNAVRDIAFSPNGKDLVSIEEFDPYVKYWNIDGLNIVPVFRFKDSKDTQPPQILVSNPPKVSDIKYRYSQDLIKITGTVIDETGVRSLRINGIEVPIRQNGNFVINYPLSVGDNTIRIEAIDVNDNISLKSFIINRPSINNADQPNPGEVKNYLLLISINNYQYWPILNNAVKDGNDLAKLLRQSYNFDSVNITSLIDNEATQNNIYKTLRNFAEKITPNDNLLIYFSGHGYFDELLNEGYWIPVDAQRNSEGDYLPNSTILKILENINSHHTFLIADACFSGSLFGEPRRGYADNVEKFKSRWGLASGRLETVSDGLPGTNSPFAIQLIKALSENKKSKLTVSELIQEIKLGVSETAGQTPIGNPLKISGDDGGEFVFIKKQNK